MIKSESKKKWPMCKSAFYHCIDTMQHHMKSVIEKPWYARDSQRFIWLDYQDKSNWDPLYCLSGEKFLLMALADLNDLKRTGSSVLR